MQNQPSCRNWTSTRGRDAENSRARASPCSESQRSRAIGENEKERPDNQTSMELSWGLVFRGWSTENILSFRSYWRLVAIEKRQSGCPRLFPTTRCGNCSFRLPSKSLVVRFTVLRPSTTTPCIILVWLGLPVLLPFWTPLLRYHPYNYFLVLKPSWTRVGKC